MPKKIRTTLSSPDLFLPPELNGAARICVEMLNQSEQYCSMFGLIEIKQSESESHTVKIKEIAEGK